MVTYKKRKGEGMNEYSIRPLPSGFWSVWRNGEWVNASLKSWEEAMRFLIELVDEDRRKEVENNGTR